MDKARITNDCHYDPHKTKKHYQTISVLPQATTQCCGFVAKQGGHRSDNKCGPNDSVRGKMMVGFCEHCSAELPLRAGLIHTA